MAERSLNARENTWGAIGSVPAAGSSASTRHYTIVDNARVAGTIYYRLRSINVNGSYSLSNVAVIHSEDRALLVSIFPNPSTGSFTVTGASAGSSIWLTDLGGKTVMRRSASANSVDQVETEGLASGCYLLHAVAADGNPVSIQLNKR